jgi:hypothetical protein
VPQPSLTYALAGKFPHTLVDRLITERKIEAAEVTVGSYKVGYRVLAPFFLESNEMVLNFNEDFIITGE